MSGRLLTLATGLVVAAQLALAAPAVAADYRGMSAGWPNYANGYYAAYYPANYGAGPAYYVARPVAYAGQPAAGTLYAPARVAYANPTYYAAYGQSPVAYRPVSTVGYAPAAGAYYAPAAPTTAYYAPVTANYAPANSYAVAPAGIGSGSEAAAYYGQPAALNYVPPRVAYRTTYAPVPVYMYRPVTAYDPVMGQPVTCLQASTCNTCQPQRSRSTWWNPFTWFNSSCGSGGCGRPATPTTAYCGSACGQPYYPAQPTVIPIVPGPASVPQNVIPSTPALPRTFPTFPAQPTIPPPPTGAGAPGAMTIPSLPRDPASIPPSLAPRTVPGAGGTIISPIPSTTVPSQPGATTPINPGFGTPGFGAPAAPPTGGSFQTNPNTGPPPGGFGAPGFGTGTNYAPPSDPSSAAAAPTNPTIGNPNANAAAPGGNQQLGPAHSVFGSGYRGSSPARPQPPVGPEGGVIRAPDLAPALPPSVQTVPDLDAPQSPRPSNSAPQLLDSRDKTARADKRWTVVPAQWPKKETALREHHSPYVAPTRVEPSPTTATANYDDRGWKSAASF